MEKLTLPDVTILASKDGIRIVHNKTGMATNVQPKQLNAWAISQLRKELTK